MAQILNNSYQANTKLHRVDKKLLRTYIWELGGRAGARVESRGPAESHFGRGPRLAQGLDE